jgi:hypothetical protein
VWIAICSSTRSATHLNDCVYSTTATSPNSFGSWASFLFWDKHHRARCSGKICPWIYSRTSILSSCIICITITTTCQWRLIGVLSSLIYLALALCLAWYRRERRAKPFIGIYTMHNPKPPHAPYDPDGRVTVKPERRFWDTDTTAKLKVYATGAAGLDWKGTLEVRGLSDIATGFYLHPAYEGGGFLQFTRMDEDIMEQGHPHDPLRPNFERLLRRLA